MGSGLPVVVIGAGVGGLTAAIELARRGEPVIVLERASRAGGKMRELEVAGRQVDAGPTVLTMRWVFDELFDRAGATLSDMVQLRHVPMLAHHVWPDGRALDLFADVARSADAIGRFAGADAARGYRAFCAYSRRIFELVEGPFMHAERPTLGTMFGLVGSLGPGVVARVDGHRSVWRALGEFFPDARLRQLFGRYATYCGSSPYEAPATLNVIAHVEQRGVWLVEGGMYRLAEALEALARRLGVSMRTSAHVDEIIVRGGRACGVRLAGGEAIDAEAVVVNADAEALARGLFGPQAVRAVSPRRAASLSALTFSFVAEVQGAALSRHNVFFSGDYRKEFDQIFGRCELADEPTVYVCAQDRDGGAAQTHGPERLFCIVNAPAHGDRHEPSQVELDQCHTRVLQVFARAGLTLRPEAPPTVTTPAQFHRLFPATGGALYGAASHGMTSPLARAPSRSKLPGLYLAGGSAHPGAGVPMVAISGRLAAESLCADLASHSRSHRPVMRGGISTSSATTQSTR